MTPRQTRSAATVVEHLRRGDDAYAAVFEAADLWNMTKDDVREAFKAEHGVSPENWKEKNHDD